MKYKMFITDLDGTLLDSKGILSDKNKEAFRRIQNLGIKTVISSGRSPRSLRNFESQVGNIAPGCYGIGFNGAVVYEADSRRVIQGITLDIPTFNFILTQLAEVSVDILIYIEDTLYIKELNESTGKYIEVSKIPYELVESFDELLTREPDKVILRGTRPQLMPIYEDMKEKANGIFNVFFSSPNLLEFTNLDATKGNALKFLAGYLGIDPCEIIAMGDNYNDIPMLKAAGLGVAMANGEPEVIAMADKVTKADNDHDAVAEVIAEYILEEFTF